MMYSLPRLNCGLLMLLSVLSFAAHGQTRSKADITRLFSELADDEATVAKCEAEGRKEQLRLHGKPLPRVNVYHCMPGCPVSLPKPYFPKDARRWRINGAVVVNAIVDENGNVVYAKASKGPSLLRTGAVEAAYLSRYQRRIACEKPIKFRVTITYNFLPDSIQVY